MKNKASDVHDHLMEQLERLNDLDQKEPGFKEELDHEIRRSEAMTKVAMTIVANGRMVIDAFNMAKEVGLNVFPDMLASGVQPVSPKLLTGKKRYYEDED